MTKPYSRHKRVLIVVVLRRRHASIGASYSFCGCPDLSVLAPRKPKQFYANEEVDLPFVNANTIVYSLGRFILELDLNQKL